MQDVYDLIDTAMHKTKYNADEFSRQKNKHKARHHHKVKRDSFLKNLERITVSLARRKVSKEQTINKLRELIR